MQKMFNASLCKSPVHRFDMLFTVETETRHRNLKEPHKIETSDTHWPHNKGSSAEHIEKEQTTEGQGLNMRKKNSKAVKPTARQIPYHPYRRRRRRRISLSEE